MIVGISAAMMTKSTFNGKQNVCKRNVMYNFKTLSPRKQNGCKQKLTFNFNSPSPTKIFTELRVPRNDRNPTLNELISQRGIVQKASGWKLYYVSTQVEEVMENEEDLEQRLEKLKERLDAEASARPSNEQDFHSLLELARGNLQRCKVVRQQLLEAKANMLNLLKHEPKIREIIAKNLAKRTIKKKERC